MNDIQVLMTEMRPHIASAVPRHVTPDRMTRVIESALQLNPKLAGLNRVRSCIVQAAQLGLEPGILDHCYLIPRAGECTLMLGYEGMVELMYRSGLVHAITTGVAYEGEEFEVTGGTEPSIIHKPNRKVKKPKNGETVIAAYAVAHLKNGNRTFAVLERAEIDHRRGRGGARSKAWEQDYAAMARKSAIRELWKWVPKTAEVQNMGLHVVPDTIDVESVVIDLPDEPEPQALPAQTGAQTNHHKLIDLCTEAGISVDAYKQHRKARIKEHGRRCTEARKQGVPQPPAPANLSPAMVASILDGKAADARPENQIPGIKDGVLTAELTDLLEGKKLSDMNVDHLGQLWVFLESQEPKFTQLKGIVTARGLELKKEVRNGSEQANDQSANS